jgi:hypothetical protein
MSYITRLFHPNELAFLMGHEINDGDTGPSFVVYTKEIGRGLRGYSEQMVVIKHPNGKFYQFVYEYDSEHGMDMFSENLYKEIKAYEVEPCEKVVVTYKKCKEQNEKDSTKTTKKTNKTKRNDG